MILVRVGSTFKLTSTSSRLVRPSAPPEEQLKQLKTVWTALPLYAIKEVFRKEYLWSISQADAGPFTRRLASDPLVSPLILP